MLRNRLRLRADEPALFAVKGVTHPADAERVRKERALCAAVGGAEESTQV